MPRRSALRVRRMNSGPMALALLKAEMVATLELFPTITFRQAARKILATRPNDSLELIEADLRAGTQLTADGVLYFADVVDKPQPKARR